MPIPIILGAVGALAGLAGTAIGEWLGGKKREEAQQILDAARDEFGRISIPRIQQLAAQELGPSAMESIAVDPEYEGAMRGALGRMKQLEDQQGLTLADRASYNEALQASGRQAAAQRAAALNAFEARGGGGANASLASALQGGSDAAMRAQQAGLQAAGDAQQRYWQSVRDRFGMGAQATQQDFGRKADVASARDAVNRWNATERSNTNRFNAGQAQQQFDNRLNVAKAKFGIAQQAAGRLDENADRTSRIGTGVGQAVGQGLDKGYDTYRRWKKGEYE